MIPNLKFVMVLLMSFSLIGCEVTPYKHILKTDAGEDIGMRCALINNIPMMCAFFVEKEVKVPVEVLVEVVVEKIVEVEKVVEIEKIVEIFITEYVHTDIDIDVFVQRVIAALPPGTTRENYDYAEVVSVVEETLVTYTPEPESTTTVKTVPDTNPISLLPPPQVSDPKDPGNNQDPGQTGGNQDPGQTDDNQDPGPQSDPLNPLSDPENPPISDENADPQLRVHGGNSIALDNPNKNLAIRTGAHDQYVCEEELEVTAYGVGTDDARGYQHWSACKVGDDVVIHLQDHPALTCNVGPNTHELQIEGVTERVTVGEQCQ